MRRDFNAYKGLVSAFLHVPGRLDEALRFAKEALERMRKDARALLLVGRVLAETAGGDDKALRAFVHALRVDPLNAEAPVLVADLVLTRH